MIRVLIVDDHVAVRRGLQDIIAGEADMEVQGEAGSAEQLRACLSQAPADVVLLDYNMPGIRGFGLLDELKRAWPRAAVLILSMHPEEDLAIASIRAGAAGYVGKDAPAENLVGAIRIVAAGGSYLSDAFATKVALGVATGKSILVEHLSARERDVLRLIASGATPKEICFTLKLSRNTVSTYRARLMKKLGVRSTAELTRYALQHHLID